MLKTKLESYFLLISFNRGRFSPNISATLTVPSAMFASTKLPSPFVNPSGLTSAGKTEGETSAEYWPFKTVVIAGRRAAKTVAEEGVELDFAYERTASTSVDLTGGRGR